MPRTSIPDRQAAAEILRRVAQVLPMPASLAGYLHGRADALAPPRPTAKTKHRE